MSYSITVDTKDGEVTRTHVSGDVPDGSHVISGHHTGATHNLAAARHDPDGAVAAQVGSTHHRHHADRAKAAYDAYREHCGGRSVHGDPLPEWDDQAPEIRGHWQAAASAIA